MSDRDWLRAGIRVVGWVLIGLAGLLVALAVVDVVAAQDWPMVGVRLVWAAGLSALGLMVLGFARVVGRRT